MAEPLDEVVVVIFPTPANAGSRGTEPQAIASGQLSSISSCWHPSRSVGVR